MTPTPNVFRHRAFALFWASRFEMTLGVQVESVAIGWQVYAIARATRSVAESAFLVGMVGLVQFLPFLALTLIAGATADRRDRKKVVIASLAVQVVCAAALAFIALNPKPSLAPIFVIAAVFGAVRAFQGPAAGSMAPMLVPREELPQAIAFNSMAWQSASILGPLLGGAVLAFSLSAAYALAAALYLGGIATLVLMRANTRPQAPEGSQMALIREGLAYVWSNKVVLGAISLDLVAVLLGGATALLPVYARDVLHADARAFGFLRGGPAIGALCAAAVFSRWPLRRNAGLWIFGGVAVFGAATLVFALSKILVVSVVALAVLGAGDMISVYVRTSLVQIVTPDPMRGRVTAVSGVFIGASNELGEFETGVVARVLGPVGAAVFGGCACLAATALWAKLFPALRKTDRLTDPVPQSGMRKVETGSSRNAL